LVDEEPRTIRVHVVAAGNIVLVESLMIVDG
jgi:hypothetical protein